MPRQRRNTLPHLSPKEPIAEEKARLRNMELLFEKRIGSLRPLNFDDGVKEIVGRVSGISGAETILIAVYGAPNSGKSYLIAALQKELDASGITALGYGAGPSARTFEYVKEEEQNPLRPRRLARIFHCGWRRREGKAYRELAGHEDPNILAEKILNRKLDLNVFIYRDNIREIGESGEYDVIVSNPGAEDKPSVYTRS